MATATTVHPCVKCSKTLGQVICGGCQKWLCVKHFGEHRQELNHQMDNLTHQHNQLRHQSVENHNDENFHPLINRIDVWEQKSIERIRRIADETRQKLRRFVDQTKRKIEESLQNLAKIIEESRSAETFTEIDLNKWSSQLDLLHLQSDQKSSIKLVHDQDEATKSIPLIQLRINKTKINGETRWNPIGQTVASSYEQNDEIIQLCRPFGLHIDDDAILFIADMNTNRIVKWQSNPTNVEIFAGGKGFGNQMNQLNQPAVVLVDRMNRRVLVTDTKNRRIMRYSLNKPNDTDGVVFMTNIVSAGLALDNDGSLYVSNFEKNQVCRYDRNNSTGLIVAGGNGPGASLKQLNRPRHLFVDQDYSIYVSDRENHRVMKWSRNARKGVVVAGGQGPGDRLNQLLSPSGIFVDSAGSLYVADTSNDRVVRWLKDAKEGEVILGGNGRGSQNIQFNQPADITVDSNGHLYVVDALNHRIQRFDITTESSNKSIEMGDKNGDGFSQRKRKK